MKALILRADPSASVATAHALTDKGFQVLCLQSLTVAHTLIRIETLDLVVLDEKIEGELTHAIALSAERRNPDLSAIILSDRPSEETDDLYALVPSLYALVGTQTAPMLLGQLAVSAIGDREDVATRMVARAAEDAVVAVGEPVDASGPAIDEEYEQDGLMPEAEADAVETEVLEPLVLSPALGTNEDEDEGRAPATATPVLPSFMNAQRQQVTLTEMVAPETVKMATEEVPAETRQKPVPDEAPQFARVDDAVLARVAELFRSSPLPQVAPASRAERAQAS